MRRRVAEQLSTALFPPFCATVVTRPSPRVYGEVIMLTTTFGTFLHAGAGLVDLVVAPESSALRCLAFSELR